MTASIQSAEQASAPVSQNPAVLICCNAYHTTYEKAIAAKHGNVFSELEAEAAFRAAMPPLSGYQNICDFIACTAYGLLIRSINTPIMPNVLSPPPKSPDPCSSTSPPHLKITLLDVQRGQNGREADFAMLRKTPKSVKYKIPVFNNIPNQKHTMKIKCL